MVTEGSPRIRGFADFASTVAAAFRTQVDARLDSPRLALAINPLKEVGCNGARERNQLSGLTLVGFFSVSTMLVFYALENRNTGFIFAFAVSCILGSIYGFLQGAWPFGMVAGNLVFSRHATLVAGVALELDGWKTHEASLIVDLSR